MDNKFEGIKEKDLKKMDKGSGIGMNLNIISEEKKSEERPEGFEISDIILEGIKRNPMSSIVTVHSNPENIKNVLDNIKNFIEDNPINDSVDSILKYNPKYIKEDFIARIHNGQFLYVKKRLDPKDLNAIILEDLVKNESLEVISEIYGISLDELNLLCKIWDIKINKNKIYQICNNHLKMIVEGYLSEIALKTKGAKLGLVSQETLMGVIEHFIDSINTLIDVWKYNEDSESEFLLPFIKEDFGLILVEVNDSEDVILDNICKYGYIEYLNEITKNVSL